jgi:sirohydrochlorin cobaltochelatase
LVIVAHGERGGAGDNAALERLARAVARSGSFATVRAGVLKGSPSLERAVGLRPAKLLHVYPLFLSDGYYVRTAIPERLRAHLESVQGEDVECLIHRPLGVEPGLAGIVARFATAALSRAGHTTAGSTLLLVGHGSTKGDESRDATEWQASRVRAFGLFAEVRTAYLENAPVLPDVLAGLGDAPCAVVGLFSGAGQHAAEDVPAAIAAAGADNAVYAGPICAAPDVARLIAASVVARTGADADRKSSSAAQQPTLASAV